MQSFFILKAFISFRKHRGRYFFCPYSINSELQPKVVCMCFLFNMTQDNRFTVRNSSLVLQCKKMDRGVTKYLLHSQQYLLEMRKKQILVVFAFVTVELLTGLHAKNMLSL